jgi:uncharacterized membrane protein YedE/YeeE
MLGHPFIDAGVGGALIGLAGTALLLLNGRIAGISGILGGVITPKRGETRWRISFVLGLLCGGAVMMVVYPESMPIALDVSLPLAALAGLLVGVGTRLGSGCTSGHGVCGVGRLSLRSMVATGVFIFTGAIAVVIVKLMTGSN